MQHGGPHSPLLSPLLILQRTDAHRGTQSLFSLPESEFHTTRQEVKNVRVWTELSLCNHDKVTAQSDTSSVYATEMQEMSWL